MKNVLLSMIFGMFFCLQAISQSVDLKTYLSQWEELRDSNKPQQLKTAMAEALKQNPGNEEITLMAYFWSRQLQFSEINQQIVKNLPSYNKNGQLAFQIRFAKLMESDREQVMNEIPNILNDFPEMPVQQKQMLVSGYINTLLSDHHYKKAIDFVEKFDPKTPFYYHSIAKEMIDKNIDIEIALNLCKKQLTIIDNTSEDTFRSLDGDRNAIRNSVNRIYARGLQKTGRLNEASEIYSLLYKANPSLENQSTESYFDILLLTKKYSELNDVLSSLAKSGQWNSMISEYLKSSLSNLGRSEKNISITISEMKNIAGKKSKEILRTESIKTPAPNFQVKKSDGTFFSLSDIKGKVIILDFWATWCSPCIAAFPGIQNVYEKYKSNPDVLIIAINSEELGHRDEETIDSFPQKQMKMSEFLTSRNFTFSSYYDSEGLSEKFKINSLPTTVFIDREGNIRFLDVKAGSESEIIRKWSERIDFLIGDN